MDNDGVEQKRFNLEENTEPIFLGEIPQGQASTVDANDSVPINFLDELKIKKTIDSWGYSLIGLGVLQIIASRWLSSTWGLTLIAVGIASFYFQSSVMMIVFAVIMGWAGIYNILGGGLGWSAFGIFQGVLTFQIARSYLRFRNIEAESEQVSPEYKLLKPNRAAEIFPLACFAMGLFSFLVFLGTIIFTLIISIVNPDSFIINSIDIIFDLITNIAVLSIASGIGSIISKFPKSWAAICGLTFGSLTAIYFVILSVLPS
jgi:hypothetical protein